MNYFGDLFSSFSFVVLVRRLRILGLELKSCTSILVLICLVGSWYVLICYGKSCVALYSVGPF